MTPGNTQNSLTMRIQSFQWTKIQSKYDCAGPSLERVPRVPGNRDILGSYVMAPVNFSEIRG